MYCCTLLYYYSISIVTASITAFSSVNCSGFLRILKSRSTFFYLIACTHLNENIKVFSKIIEPIIGFIT